MDSSSSKFVPCITQWRSRSGYMGYAILLVSLFRRDQLISYKAWLRPVSVTCVSRDRLQNSYPHIQRSYLFLRVIVQQQTNNGCIEPQGSTFG